MKDDSLEILFQSFLREAIVRQILAWPGLSTLRHCPSGISLRTTASHTLQGALKDGFRDAVDFVPQPSRWSCAPSRRCGQISACTYPFLKVSKQGICLTSIEEDGGDKDLVQLELACKADCVASPDPVLILSSLPLLMRNRRFIFIYILMKIIK